MAEEIFKRYRNNPAHLFRANGVYIITGAIYEKAHLINTDQRKSQWLGAFQKAAELYRWEVIAWVVLINHYHVIVRAPEDSAQSLPKFVGSYHKFTSRQWNDADGKNGRQVWWNYWDTCIRSEPDYLTRFNYVNWNPVKHGVVSRPEDYLFSSYREYFATRSHELRAFEAEYPYHNVRDVPDDF
jgi:putative transposase